MSDGTPEFSSFLSADGLTEGHGIAVENNTVYITGQTNSASFPTTSVLRTVAPGGENAFVTALKVTTSQADYLYSTFLGGSGRDSSAAIAVDGEETSTLRGPHPHLISRP